MADEKSIVKMNKMIHEKTRASFLVVYVIYVSLVHTDSKKTASCLLPRHTIFATYGRQIKMPTCTHTGRFISVPSVLFVQFNNQLDVWHKEIVRKSKWLLFKS